MFVNIAIRDVTKKDQLSSHVKISVTCVTGHVTVFVALTDCP